MAIYLATFRPNTFHNSSASGLALNWTNNVYMFWCIYPKLARSDNFAIEKGKAEKAITWMNNYATTRNKKFHAELIGYNLSTVNFGTFEVITWEGEWSAARHIIVKVSSKLNMKIIEAGYHSKSNILESFLGLGKEYGKVYSGGVLTGNIILGIKKGKIIADSEKLV